MCFVRFTIRSSEEYNEITNKQKKHIMRTVVRDLFCMHLQFTNLLFFKAGCPHTHTSVKCLFGDTFYGNILRILIRKYPQYMRNEWCVHGDSITINDNFVTSLRHQQFDVI